jgi:hypothetical protein
VTDEHASLLRGEEQSLAASRAFSTYLAIVSVAGVVVFVYAAAVFMTHGIAGGYTVGFALLCALLVLSEARPMSYLRRHAGTDVTISWTFAFALVLLSPPGGVLAMGFASALGGSCSRSRRAGARSRGTPSRLPMLLRSSPRRRSRSA